MKPVPLIAVSLLAALGAGAALAGEDCAAKAARSHEINLSSGVYSERAVAMVPLTLRVPAGTDGAAYAACMKLEGFDPAQRMAAEVTRAGLCRDGARRVMLRPASSGTAARISSAVDEHQYRDCLAANIGVQVLPGDPP